MDSDIDFVKLVENPTWKDVLIGLVNREELDPWDIDISKLTSKYIRFIGKMKKFELHIPANLILAASVMLRIKSDSIVLKEDGDYEAEYLVDDIPSELDFNPNFTSIESVPELKYRAKLPRKRKVTLNELLNAVEDAMKSEFNAERRRTKMPIKDQKFFEELEIDKVDVEELMMNTYQNLRANADKYNLARFDEICGNTTEEMVLSLLAVLYLCSYNYVDVMQEKFFGDILIKVLDPKKELGKIDVSF